MTPDEVVARAKELEEQEVLLTVRGEVEVRDDGDCFLISDNRCLRIGEPRFTEEWLVNIEPAPMRIVTGQRYADAEGRLFEGDSDGGLWELAAGYILAGEVWELDGLRPVRVVDA